MYKIQTILEKDFFTKDDLITLLNTDENDAKLIFEKSYKVKLKYVGAKVYFRGLIEVSNICSKDCYYCGIRKSNKNTDRYEIDEKSILEAAKYAYDNNFASIVLQGGERTDKKFIDKIDNVLKELKKLSNGKLGITLSLGEQSEEVYRRWFESGAHRYLLRIETSNRELYEKIHPKNKKHSFDERLKALYTLKKIGFQTGTGVMVGLPFQTVENLADDLIFFREFDIDMNGMGPFLEHEDAPLWEYRHLLLSQQERLFLTLKMIALLRIMMKDINITSTTALQVIDPKGREKALKAGANIIMPNITPAIHRKNYQIYQNKPGINDNPIDSTSKIENQVKSVGEEIVYNEWGDSKHFEIRKK